MPPELLISPINFIEQGQLGNWLEHANSETCLPERQAGIQVFVKP